MYYNLLKLKELNIIVSSFSFGVKYFAEKLEMQMTPFSEMAVLSMILLYQN
jgi:hypothetical protein